MRKIVTGLAAALALFVIACGAAPKSDTVSKAPAATGSGAPVAGAAADTKAAAPEGPKKFAVGEVGVLSMANGSTGEVVVKSVKLQGKVIVVSVSITCKAGSIDYNTFDWSMLAGDGTKLDTGFSIDVKNQLHSGTIGAGQSVTGNLVFEGTAAQMKGAQVQFSPSFDTLAYWVNP
ncbi:DUF4352 domain-containing protein [Dactylosporangium sucinum]|uniref:DUF4352 domain-containing protein n=1 Tax=Dactylosporangium sucinum TaxID=1424081 RepID=A0A917TNX1_9ACTN|nr:DUF4352 domain-containing protein [Dactylosporangium sucinum]GGM27876.1 hypothetical protein GCM10007977_031460 [Dactylosporangium sucinum]